MSLTPEQQCVRLAEFEGFEPVQPYKEIGSDEVRYYHRGSYYGADELSNYLCPLTGLGHLHRVEGMLTDEQHESFRGHLKARDSQDPQGRATHS